ncbi:endolytic transglycosylase MltG [Psychrobium sp. 1_MG-2023]|uniref:endolytic transglycosylase MltG n=1 Tax=Psychrobium sp. 1_MG-2023 TaxID=3062624 RepID=UPI000C33C56A|nr:endolytic transglycosylase MltG [Psychrobium sp. 1_MG-2023]MDP2561683.1 endolytic transglycosylase MltG [Psychrobium sp. 1_MG-2023]PKF57087.1 endolytic transglycosylase MltG [Alteromonadales bacterium alter-6D02]
MTEQTTPSKNWIKRITFFVLICALLVGGLLIKLWQDYDQFTHTPITTLKPQTFKVVAGDNVARVLSRLNLAKEPMEQWQYKALLKQQPSLSRLKVGTYQISQSLTPVQLLQLLVSGVETQYAITLIEGHSFSQWLDTLKKHQHIDSSNLTLESISAHFSFEPIPLLDQTKYPFAHIESQFYPDTYYFTDQTPALNILERAAKRLQENLITAWQTRDENLAFENIEQVLVIASIIEKETAIASERTTVASVFNNRLKRRMRLQTDPTVIYGVADEYNGDITRAHLRDKNPFNTYVIKGLPPAPIAMASWESIEAALNPKDTNYLYFVASGDGGHNFSTNLAEHNRALRRYLARNKH